MRIHWYCSRMKRRDLARLGGALVLGSTLAACSDDTPPSENPAPTEADLEASASPEASKQPTLMAAGVAAGHPLAVTAGSDILQRGGNAVDAAIATAFADSVLQPEASGIGGGGSAIIASPDMVDYLDYRDEVNTSGEIPDNGSGVPGLVAGLAALHEKYGSFEWSALLEPAIILARDGAPVSEYLAQQLGYLTIDPSVCPQFFTPDGAPLAAGENLVQSELADVLRVIADDGPTGFYAGEIAGGLAKAPGLDRESLAAYEGQWSTPPSGPVGDYTMISASPALPGAAVIQNLQLAESLGISQTEPNSAEFFDLHARAWRHTLYSIQTYFSDPNFREVPTETLTDPEANARLSQEEPPEPPADGDTADGNTTHICVVDRDGLVVSMTNTVTSYWGSKTYNQGFFLNDSLRRFEDIGGTSTNIPHPGARSVSWSAPSLLLDAEKRPALVVGLPGGRQIPSALATVISLWALQGMSVKDAVMAPRFQLLATGVLRLEDAELAGAMEDLGYTVEVPEQQQTFGSVQAIALDWRSGALSGHADPRRGAAVEITP